MSDLTLLGDGLSVSRLEPSASVPEWAEGPGLTSVTRTAEELSVLCRTDRVPSGVKSEAGWRAFQVAGPLAFTQVGILSGLVLPLAEARVPVFVISTFDTDYLLVRETTLETACRAFTDSGHRIHR